jgi:hypothetical protein
MAHVAGDTVSADGTMKKPFSFDNHIHKGLLPFLEVLFFEFIGSQAWD